MIKRELKINRKSLITWTLILIGTFLVAFLIYPSIIDENTKIFDEMLNSFPAEMLRMFNMDIADISTVFGWFKTEGYVFLLLIFGTYSAILGSTILVKEESDKTIEFLYSRPITRDKIVSSKIITGVINISVMVFTVTIFNLIGLKISNDLELKSFLLLSLTPLLICYSLFFVTMFISTFFNKTKKTMGIGLALVFISYFLQIISAMGDKYSFIKYFSVFSLVDARYIINNNSIKLISIFISVIIIIISLVGIYKNYERKELV